MMRAPVYDKSGNKVEEIELPEHFEEEIRPDLIKRAVLAIYSHKRQPYGVYEYAGLEASAWTSKRRRTYRSSYGRGISRVPRALFSGKGFRYAWVARVVPNVVKGRKAHPPKAEKNWYEKINKKERRKAIRSAIAATANPYFVINRYNGSKDIVEKIVNKYGLPLIFKDIESISRARDLREFLKSTEIYEFVRYVKNTKRQRSGKGKRRGRRIKMQRGLLLVTSSESNVRRVSLEGVEVVPVNKLNTEILAPGTHPGRLTVWSREAISELRELFL